METENEVEEKGKKYPKYTRNSETNALDVRASALVRKRNGKSTSFYIKKEYKDKPNERQ